jgi:hypothetical protein
MGITFWDSIEILTWDFSKLPGNFYLILESLVNPPKSPHFPTIKLKIQKIYPQALHIKVNKKKLP